MSKKIVADVPEMTAAHREAIAAAAKARGYEAVFPGDRAEAVAASADAEIIFGMRMSLPKAAPQLRWLCVPSAGVDYCVADDVYANPDAVLTNSSGAYGVTIAEHTVMVALELMRRQMEYTDIVDRRSWERQLPVHGIIGSRVTLLGTGDIGREVCARLRPFRPARIVGVNRSGRDPGGFDRVVPLSGLDALLPETDLLVMSLPGTPETAGLMDERRLRSLPADAFIVNVGRGSAIDQKALERLMREGHLAGAALDVFVTEPLPPEDTLWSCPRLLITPHCAGNMTLPYTLDRIVAMFLEDFENYCEGRPMKRLVDRKRGY
ncbi:MAG: D-2-hydroxyacid dehydrogenase [Clostridia bacterium]|nr:D-2-hydroxyacid dehydrogenase [Clostridia bacterium]